MEKILNKKIYAPILILILILISVAMTAVMPKFLGLQGFMIVFIGALSIMAILGLLDGGFKNMDKVSKITYLSTVIICIGLFFQLKYTNVEIREVKLDYTIHDAGKFYLLDIEGYKLLTLDKNSTKFDENNAINLYEFYKTDLFGYELLPNIKVKSGLMEDYIEPERLIKY